LWLERALNIGGKMEFRRAEFRRAEFRRAEFRRAEFRRGRKKVKEWRKSGRLGMKRNAEVERSRRKTLRVI
jgi:hypothetical protein